MAVMGKWNGHVFEVSANVMRGFKDLTVKQSAETDDKNKSNQYFVKFKKAKGVEVSLTVLLTAALGCDVRSEVDGFISDARKGASAYFYVGKGKLRPCQLMLTDVSVKDVKMPGGKNAGNRWTAASVQLTLKQASIDDVEQVEKKSSGSSSKKKSSKKSSGSGSSSSSKMTGTIVMADAAKAAKQAVVNVVTKAKASSSKAPTITTTASTKFSKTAVKKVLGA